MLTRFSGFPHTKNARTSWGTVLRSGRAKEPRLQDGSLCATETRLRARLFCGAISRPSRLNVTAPSLSGGPAACKEAAKVGE